MLLGLLKMIMKPKVKKALTKLSKDPEMQAAVDSHRHHAERLKKTVNKMGDSADPKLRKLADML